MILEQIDKDLLKMAEESDVILKDIYKKIDDVCLYNSDRILAAFIENHVSYSDFADINGYGNYDEGRDKIERIFATVCSSTSSDYEWYKRFIFNFICSIKTWRYNDFHFWCSI